LGFSNKRKCHRCCEYGSSCDLYFWSNVKDLIMINLVIGFVLGITVATVGFSGVASFADKQIDSAKEVIKENVK
jgi:capsular polysaccharide biosynthesis protein